MFVCIVYFLPPVDFIPGFLLPVAENEMDTEKTEQSVQALETRRLGEGSHLFWHFSQR